MVEIIRTQPVREDSIKKFIDERCVVKSNVRITGYKLYGGVYGVA